MSRALRAPRSKRNTDHKTARPALFDPAAFLETTANGRVISTHSKKDLIFAQGDDADSVFYIRKGKVKVAIVSKQGKEAVIALLGPDEFLGEGCLIGQPKRLGTASAMSECETMRVAKTEIQRVLNDEPAFSQMFGAYFGEERPGRRILSRSAFQLNRKTACAPAIAIGQFRKGRPTAAHPREDQSGDTRGVIGTTRSRVSHFMNNPVN
jgi:CRP/FNR family transcriptional regulator, cyclic AMP receptor protein